MTRKIGLFAALLGLLLNFAAVPVSAKDQSNPSDNGPVVTSDEDVVYLGKAKDKDGREVEGYSFIHYKQGTAKRANARPGSGSTTCYAYLAKGAKWKHTENWVINPSNDAGLNTNNVVSNFSADVAKWNFAAQHSEIGTGQSTSNTLSAETSSPDGVNEVMFGNASGTGVIAVTTVWGIFYGPASGRELVEWDMVIDDVDFDWSLQADGVANKMDFENIVTHELGHAMGMGHPSDSCTEETMYRYADYAETKKRDLNSGDIEGVFKLYQ